ncbi:LysR family transcriptional regulator [Sphingomonas immobilis]|uniref:LysR family transcriptional regulator n=1 Tax=Sphingomonas immobilis TaxID=3063997 RepID=A0ABT8ZY43_9SPHN|nr:LysR family transcriptional regulator [Sphingomonas sp. CA1-15]MDO7842500.1 LysR family transcriptional regulator [Sphingomonas sp. CA1-15]
MRIERIEDLRVFDAIARAGNLSAAARQLDVALTLISKRLNRLEKTLGIRLIHRTTRQLYLTEEGLEFLDRCRAVLEAVDAAEDVGADRTQNGVVRVTAAVAFTQRQIAPRLHRFIKAHPGISVQVLSNNRLVDLVEQRVDAAFRQAPLDNGSFVTRTIAPDGEILCASPAYLAECGEPAHPGELIDHRCLTTGDPAPTSWALQRRGEQIHAPVRSVLGSTDGELPHIAALNGAGIVVKSCWDAIDDIRSGRLVRVLPEWWGRSRSLRVMQPVRQHQPRRVQLFIQFMEAELKEAVAANRDLDLFPTTNA